MLAPQLTICDEPLRQSGGVQMREGLGTQAGLGHVDGKGVSASVRGTETTHKSLSARARLNLTSPAVQQKGESSEH